MMAIATENCACGAKPGDEHAPSCLAWGEEGRVSWERLARAQELAGRACQTQPPGLMDRGGRTAPPPADVAPARGPTEPPPADLRRLGLIEPQDTLPLRVALAVYACSWGEQIPGHEIRAAWVGEELALREGVWNVCYAALEACGEASQLQSLRSTALKVLAIEPALGQQLVADLAALDAALTVPG